MTSLQEWIKTGVVTRVSAVVLTSFIVAACSGGSGGGGGSSSGPSPEPINGDDGDTDQPDNGDNGGGGSQGSISTFGVYYEDEEGIENPWTFSSSTYDEAVDLGLLSEPEDDQPQGRAVDETGEGLLITVWDGDFNLNNPQLSERPGSNEYQVNSNREDNPDASYGGQNDAILHGNHVASIAAGRYGIAPKADIYAFSAAYQDEDDDDINLVSPFSEDYFTDTPENDLPDVMNYSMGSPFSMGFDSNFREDDRQAVLDNEVVIAMAAGNNGNEKPFSRTGISYIDPNHDEPGGLGVIVGALNDSGEIAYFSNRAGDTWDDNDLPGSRQYFITAPGTNIHAADDEDGVRGSSGTSMATPIVSGTLALMIERWDDQMSRDEIVGRMFITADRDFSDFEDSLEDAEDTEVDRYDHELSPIYGHGRLDIGAALSPLGELTIADSDTVAQGGEKLADTAAMMGSAFGDALSQSEGLRNIATFDELGFNFEADLTTAINEAHGRETIDYGERLGLLSTPTHEEHIDGSGFSMNLAMRSGRDGLHLSENARNDLEMFSAMLQFDGGGFFGFHQSDTDQRTPWGSDVLTEQPLMLETAGAQRLSGWDQATALNAGMPFDTEGRYRMVAQLVRADDRVHADESAHAALRDAKAQGARESEEAYQYELGIQAEPADGTLIDARIGQLHQDGRFLNSDGYGALALNEGATTTTLSLGARQTWGNFSVFGEHEQGQTRMNATDNGLLAGFDTLRTAQSAFGAEFSGDEMTAGLVYSEPLRVRSGSAELDLPVGRDPDGNVIRVEESVSLSPSGREQRVEAFLVTPLAVGNISGQARFHAALREEPDNVAAADRDYFVGGLYEGRF